MAMQHARAITSFEDGFNVPDVLNATRFKVIFNPKTCSLNH